MPHSFIETSTLRELKVVLNGGIVGGTKLTDSRGVVNGLHGKTLIINGTTITFSDVNGNGLKLVGTGSVKAVIEAAVAGTTVSYSEGRLLLEHASGVTVDKDGTSNPIFGIGTSADSVGTVYAGPNGSVPKVLSVNGGTRMDSYFAWVEVS